MLGLNEEVLITENTEVDFLTVFTAHQIFSSEDSSAEESKNYG